MRKLILSSISSQVLPETLSSPVALTVYIIVLMLSVAVLTAYVLVALHLLRKVPQNGTVAKQSEENQLRQLRFANLSRIDDEQKKQTVSVYDHRSLPQICEEFRDFAAGKLGLYYDIADIRRFVAGLGMSRLMIIRGMSGTGKTSLAYAAGAFFGNPSVIVPVQPMWKERSDMIGYFNEFTKRFNETTLLCKLYEAGGRDDIYIIVLDEVNISRIEYYFAEFLSLLEIPDPKERELDVVSDVWDNDPKRLHMGKLRLPENVWFIGTANNDDSTFAISDKVYDRAAVLDLDKKSAPFMAKPLEAAHISWRELGARFAEARGSHSMSQASSERLAKLDTYLTKTFRISFGNRIMRQMQEYVPVMVACGGTELGAMDDILSRKILRKLEQLSPVLLRSEIPALIAMLEMLFGANEMPQSRECLERLAKST